VFAGTIPQPMRNIVAEVCRPWPGDLWVACSGNLTIERIAHPWGRPVHSNDVNPYTTALGLLFTGQKVPYRLKEHAREQLGWMEPYLDDGIGTVAALMLGTNFLNDVGKDVVYYRRMVDGWRRQFPSLHEQTVKRLEGVRLRLASYYLGDVREYLRDAVPPDGGVVSFPPFFKGGYEKMFEGISGNFDWPEPSYEILDGPGIRHTLELIMDRPRWLMAVPERMGEIDEHLIGYVKPSPGAKEFWVYSSDRRPRVYLPRMTVEPVTIPRLGPGDVVGDRLGLVQLTQGQFVGLRSEYLNPGIKPGNPSISLAVVAGGRMVGAFGLDRWQPDPSTAFLLSDFPVSGSDYPRLSKLVVLAAMSRESRMLMQRMYSRAMPKVATTVFTRRATSAKYGRGIPGMRLTNRKPVNDGKSALTYSAPFGQWTLEEALRMWMQSHAQRKADG
jgi:hypothetical protein